MKSFVASLLLIALFVFPTFGIGAVNSPAAAQPASDAGSRYYVCFTATDQIPNDTSTISTTKCLYITVIGACTKYTADVDLQGTVNIVDASAVAFHFGENVTGPEPYNPMNTPGIGIEDASCVASRYDQTGTLPD